MKKTDKGTGPGISQHNTTVTNVAEGLVRILLHVPCSILAGFLLFWGGLGGQG